MASIMARVYLKVSGATQPIMDQRCFVLRGTSHGFFASAEIHGIEIPFSSDHLTDAITRVIGKMGSTPVTLDQLLTLAAEVSACTRVNVLWKL